MRLEPLYSVTFTTPEAWSVEVAADAGTEGRGFLLAEGHSTGRLSARYRAANFPRKRTDGTLVPEFRGVSRTARTGWSAPWCDARCGSNLGHVFDESPREAGGQRWCMNSVALDLERC